MYLRSCSDRRTADLEREVGSVEYKGRHPGQRRIVALELLPDPSMKLSTAFALVAVLFTSGAIARVARRQSGGCDCAGESRAHSGI